MKTAHDIILKPVITENSMAGIADKKYTFKVATDATKVEIAQAVETLFPGAKVAKVNTISVRGRFRRQGTVSYTHLRRRSFCVVCGRGGNHCAGGRFGTDHLGDHRTGPVGVAGRRAPACLLYTSYKCGNVKISGENFAISSKR